MWSGPIAPTGAPDGRARSAGSPRRRGRKPESRAGSSRVPRPAGGGPGATSRPPRWPGEHVLNGGVQFPNTASLHRAGRSLRRDAGLKQGLADVDVAEPGNGPLVQERRLDGRRAALQACRQGGPIEDRLQGFRAEVRQHAVVGQVRRRAQIHEAEAPGVVVADHATCVGFEDDVVVGLFRRRRRGEHPEPAGHAEMGDPDRVVVEADGQELGPPAHLYDPSAGQALAEIVGQRPAQLTPPDHHPGQALAL